MRRSLVTRLAFLITAVIVVAFLLILVIVHRATSATFVETQVEIHGKANTDTLAHAGFADSICSRWKIGGWEAIRSTIGEWQPEEQVLLVFDDDLVLKVTNNPALNEATVQRSPAGVYQINAGDSDEDVFQIAVRTEQATTLRDEESGVFGYLFVLPPLDEPVTGDLFASRVWKSAAIWLVLTAAVSLFATVWILRRSLSPIDQLTRAAKELQSGSIPEPIRHRGDREFAGLIEAFEAAARNIAETTQMRKQLISDIAHELRTPLTNIKGQLEAAESGLISLGDELVATLQSEARLLERLVDDFQELAISDAGQLEINLQSLPLDELVHNILVPIASQSDARLVINIDPAIAVLVDEDRMKQVLGNLMDNALRHGPRRLILNVASRTEGEFVFLRVTDNGPGIDPEHQPHVFNRFYRAEKSRNRETGGSGLGLAIVQELVEAMGGRICYVPLKDSGACFELQLRQADEVETQTAE